MPADPANLSGTEDSPERAPLPFVSRLRIKGASADGRPPESSAAGYFLIREGNKAGPFKRELVETLLRAGQASPRDLGWQEGQSGWRPLGELLPGVNPVMRRPTDALPDPVLRERPDPDNFGPLLFGSLAYPFRGDGLIILVAGGLALLFLNFAVGFLSLFSWIMGIATTGYLFGALQLIVHSSAQGEAELPRWPDIQAGTTDMLQPIWLWLATLLGCFGPALLAGAVAWQLESETLTGCALALALGGFVYYPMALLGVAMTHSLAGMNPVLVLCSIGRIPGRYAAAVALLALVMAGQIFGSFLADQMPSKVVGYAWNGFNSLYFAIVQARILGVIYYANREKLQWF